VYDAAAAFHFRKMHIGDKYDYRSIYPWKGRIKEQFLYQAQQEPLFPFNKRYCKKIYTAECLGIVDWKIQGNNAISSQGLTHALGGFLEAVWNKRRPKFNLIPSSFLFPLHSRWHQIGRRVQWNGYRGKKLQITWSDQYGVGEEIPRQSVYPIAFRCMRTEWQ